MSGIKVKVGQVWKLNSNGKKWKITNIIGLMCYGIEQGANNGEEAFGQLLKDGTLKDGTPDAMWGGYSLFPSEEPQVATAASVKSDGMNCANKFCNTYCQFAEPNMPDGTFKCYSCRKR
jgi:hypothetical protein